MKLMIGLADARFREDLLRAAFEVYGVRIGS
jgi:hypothetical protein